MKAMKEFVHRMLFDCTFFLKKPYGIHPAEEIVPKETRFTDRLVGCALSRPAEEKPYP